MKKLILIACLALSQAQAFETYLSPIGDMGTAYDIVYEYLGAKSFEEVEEFCYTDSGVDSDDETINEACILINGE